MAIDDKIRDDKLQCDINRTSTKTSALLSTKIDKYEYLRGEVILPKQQRRLIHEAKLTYSSFRKALEKQVKTIEKQGEKQREAIKEQG